ncbi:MAG: outer membrane beta-barrel protein [Ignavibacteriales bacterium]|nr:outer membrane beta-barrel protein [Ignavibacteriales bacterium]
MFQYRSFMMSKRSMSLWLKKIILSSFILVCAHATILAQEIQRAQPTWWYGVSGAANFNWYNGTTQKLNSTLTASGAFHEGDGVGFNAALFLEYRPTTVWGGILQVGYDDRSGSFHRVIAPCNNCPDWLSTRISYITIEPSLRIAPFSSRLYFFLGPVLSFNVGKDFTYTHEGNPGFRVKGTFSDMRPVVLTGQVGIGWDIPLVSSDAATQINVAPFVSFLPDMENPRTADHWGITTLRVGAAIKFGWGDVISHVAVPLPAVVERDVQFSIRPPKAVPAKRRVRETFPLRNYVFFEAGSTELPNRYVALTKDQAASFKEEQLQEVQPINMTGRSLRQMTVYYNILNIVGDRMKRNSGTAISLSGASENGPEHGKARAETIKRYLVDVFGIDGSRITTEGRDKPRLPSEVPGATKELALVRAGDRRVDIESTSPEMMIQVGGGPHYMLRPVQIVSVVEDPLDSQVLFNVAGAKEVLASWSLEITDELGTVQRYGPFTRDQEGISGNAILGDRSQGDYKVVMLGERKLGKSLRKEGSVQLARRSEPLKEAVRFSILFEFDKSKTIASYEKFLTEVVTPLIPDNGKVIIHGHTDIVGEEDYNDNLSRERVEDARGIIERAILSSGKRGITFETFGFGENLQYAPFDNYFPEERFYNRTVIIDIVPD